MSKYEKDPIFNSLTKALVFVLEDVGTRYVRFYVDMGIPLEEGLRVQLGIPKKNNKPRPPRLGFTFCGKEDENLTLDFEMKALKTSSFLSDHPSLYELFKTPKGRSELVTFLNKAGSDFPQGLTSEMWPGLSEVFSYAQKMIKNTSNNN